MDPTQGDRESTRSRRQLRYIWLPDGRNFAEVLIAEGCGFEFTCRLLYRYRERSKAALRRAKLPRSVRFHDLRRLCAALVRRGASTRGRSWRRSGTRTSGSR
jgi:hypothetical protein